MIDGGEPSGEKGVIRMSRTTALWTSAILAVAFTLLVGVVLLKSNFFTVSQDAAARGQTTTIVATGGQSPAAAGSQVGDRPTLEREHGEDSERDDD